MLPTKVGSASRARSRRGPSTIGQRPIVLLGCSLLVTMAALGISVVPAGAATTDPPRDPASDLLITAATNDLMLPVTSMPSAGTGVLGTRTAQRVAADRRRQEQAAADLLARSTTTTTAGRSSGAATSSTDRTVLAQSRHGADVAGFLACTKVIESNGNYAAVDPSGTYHGAYQFDQPTWNGAVARAGYPEWAGRDPASAPPGVQDAAAIQLYAERGNQPWGGRC